jgi:actin
MNQLNGISVVIDNGSAMCRVGFSGDDAPISSFPTVTAAPSIEGHIPETNNYKCYVGK